MFSPRFITLFLASLCLTNVSSGSGILYFCVRSVAALFICGRRDIYQRVQLAQKLRHALWNTYADEIEPIAKSCDFPSNLLRWSECCKIVLSCRLDLCIQNCLCAQPSIYRIDIALLRNRRSPQYYVWYRQAPTLPQISNWTCFLEALDATAQLFMLVTTGL